MRQRIIWWASLALIGGAAAGITGWSLYKVAHEIYGVPHELALLTAAVYDGTAIAALYLAGQAVHEGRSALGPHLATLGMAGASVYLNRIHAEHIHGGLGATLLFATPTVALLLITGLAWSGVRARNRAAAGDSPVALPRYGFWGWLIATEDAWAATKRRVVTHVTSTDTVRIPSGRPARTASETLRSHFADMDPADAIRFANEAKPGTPPADLAAELVSYGVHVSAVQVALVLGQQPPEVYIHRAAPTEPPPGPRPTSIIDAAKIVASWGIRDEEKATEAVSALLGRPVKQETVRRYLDGPAKPPPAAVQPPLPGAGQGGEGYN